MVLLNRHYFRWFVGTGFLFSMTIAAWFGWCWLTKGEGNSEEVFSRLRVGMGQQEAVEILQAFEASSSTYSRGVTTDGREFDFLSGVPSMDDLPSPGEIKYCILEAEDNLGREIKVTLGPGGIVSSKRLSPGIWKLRRDKAYRELRDKPYEKLLHKYRYIALSLAALLVLALAWTLRHWVVKGKACHDT
jgi:hypothetical protein